MPNSFFRNAFDRVTAAREKQARRYVGAYLRTLDDESLKALGYNRSDLKNTGPGAPILF